MMAGKKTKKVRKAKKVERRASAYPYPGSVDGRLAALEVWKYTSPNTVTDSLGQSESQTDAWVMFVMLAEDVPATVDGDTTPQFVTYTCENDEAVNGLLQAVTEREHAAKAEPIMHADNTVTAREGGPPHRFHGERLSTFDPSGFIGARFKRGPQTFTVEAAAQKMLRRVVHSRLGGKDDWAPCYDGALTLDNLEGRETVTPFGKSLPKTAAKVAVPKAKVDFGESDDDFRRRRRLRREAKRHNKDTKEERAKLAKKGQVYVKAYHPSSTGTVSGVSVDGRCRCEPSPNTAGGAAGHDMYEVPGEVVANNNMYASVLTETEANDHVVVWYYGDVVIGVSETDDNLEGRV